MNVHGLYITVNVENEAVVVGLLLGDDSVEADPRGNDDRTPLNLSACCGHTKAVRALLGHHRVELIPVTGTVGRRYIILFGRDIMRLLLNSDRVDVNLKGERGRAP